MNKWKLGFIIMLCFSLFMVGNHVVAQEMSLDEMINQVVEGVRKDAEVTITDDVQFKTMTTEEKKALYKELDGIEKHTTGTSAIDTYSNVKELKSDEDFQSFLSSTDDEAKIIYLGFDECPYCRAFTPKLNQFAKENNITVHYYNVRKRANDADFEKNITQFNIETVPHAFIMHKGEIIAKINHKSTMTAIEAFVNKVLELNK